MVHIKVLKNFIIIGLTLLMTGCPIVPSSRLYKTIDWETTLYQNSTRCVFPDDIRINPEKYMKFQNMINWVGIIKNVDTKLNSDTGVIMITMEHKYWDYIEDFSIQDEKMFVSPHGEGEFYYIEKRLNATQGMLDTMAMNLKYNDLGICYGHFIGLKDSLPQIAGQGIRFIPYKYYTTKIMSYKAEKDSITGVTVCDENNMYETTDFQLLKVPGPGQNK